MSSGKSLKNDTFTKSDMYIFSVCLACACLSQCQWKVMIGKAQRMRASAQYVDLRQKCEMTSFSMHMAESREVVGDMDGSDRVEWGRRTEAAAGPWSATSGGLEGHRSSPAPGVGGLAPWSSYRSTNAALPEEGLAGSVWTGLCLYRLYRCAQWLSSEGVNRADRDTSPRPRRLAWQHSRRFCASSGMSLA